MNSKCEMSRWRGLFGATLAAVALSVAVAPACAQSIKAQKVGNAKTSRQAPKKIKGQSVKVQVAPKAGATPKIQVDEDKHEFGEVWAGTQVNHTFEVRNTGDAVLNITKVKPSCGCTVAQQYDRTIAPGGVGKIPVTINTARLKSKITKTITVSSNDPVKASYRLTMTGTVKERFTIDPVRGGSFGRIRPDEEIERHLTLTNNMDQPAELTLPMAKAGVFTGELVTKTPGQVYELIIHAKPPYAEKVNRGNFKLNTSLEDKSTINLAVSAFVPPMVEVTPPQVVIPNAQATARQQSVRVKFNSNTPHKVVSATVDAPGVEVEVKEIAAGQYNLILGLPANYQPPVGGHKLTIKTDDPKNPEKVVNISRTRTLARNKPQRPAMQLSGKPVPNATFTMTDGTTVSTADMKDDATLVMFYASWCGFCKRTLPKIEQYSKELEGKSARFLCVSMDTLKSSGGTGKRAKTKEQITDQWKTMGLTLPQALDTNKAGSSLFKVQSFPTLFLLGKTGKVERVYVGGGAASNGSLKRDIDTLLAGKKLPPQQVAPPVAQKPQRPAMQLAGKPVPPTTFTVAADDSTASLKDTDADATLAFFYASWCGYCKKTLPKLNEMAKAYEGKSVRFIGVNQDTIVDKLSPANRRGKTKEQVTKQWADFGVTFPQWLDLQANGRKAFKVSSFPTMFLIGKDGKVDRVYLGGGAVDNGSVKKDIDTLLAGKTLSPQQVAAAPPQRPRRPAMQMVGKQAPTGTFVSTADGSPINFAEPDADATLAFFYASWCPHCKKALPKLSDMVAKEYAGKPVRFVGVSQDTIVDQLDPKNRRGRTREQVVQQWKDLGIKFPQALDPAKVGRNGFKVSSFPTMFLINKTGKIEKVYVGGRAADDGSLKKDVDTLLAGKTLSQAGTLGNPIRLGAPQK